MIESTRRKTLLETPSGFALFDVDEDALKQTDDIWVYFRDVATAKKVMLCLGFIQFADKSTAWDGETQPSKDLIRLIQKFCKGTKDLFVQSDKLQTIIKGKLKVNCSYEHTVVDELIWGMKNVLHGFIFQEIKNIDREYCLPMSKGLQQFLQNNLIKVSPTKLDRKFISEIGLLRYVDTTLEQVPKTLRESFDEHVCRIGESIENNLDYAKVLAKILVPELAPKHDFFEMFPLELALKIQEADKCAAQYRDKKRTLHTIEIIMGGLSHLLTLPKERNEILIRVKHMELELKAKMMAFDAAYGVPIRLPSDLKHPTYRRTLLETPSGFAIFDVNEDVLKRPQHIWEWFASEAGAHEVVLALGFVKVHDKSIVRDSCQGPGLELSRLIRKLCPHKPELIVQDNDLKSVIEEKLKISCCTKFSNDDDSLGDLMWGLKHVLHEFIPQEDNLTEDYYLPMSKGLQNALLSYGVSGKMDRKSVYVLGYLEYLDWTSTIVPLIFRESFDGHVSYIGQLIEDHLDYAKVVAYVLVPRFAQEFDVKSLPSYLAEKVTEVAIKVKESGDSINASDMKLIIAVLSYLSDVPEKKDGCLQFLNCKDSEKELPRTWGYYDDIVNSWLTKNSLSEKYVNVVLHQMKDEMPHQTEDGKGDIEGTMAPKKAAREARNTFPGAENTGKIKFSEDKSVQAHDSSEKVPNVEEHVDPSTEKSVGTDDLKIMCRVETPYNIKLQQQPHSISEAADHLAISKGADNADQPHYPIITEGDVQAMSSADGPASANVASTCVAANTTMNDIMQKDVPSGTVMQSQVKTEEVNSICNVGESKDEEVSANPSSHKTIAVYTTGTDDEQKNGVPFVNLTFSMDTICSINGVEDKQCINYRTSQFH